MKKKNMEEAIDTVVEEVIEEVVDTVVEEVIAPVVEEVVEPVVEETVEEVVEEVVEPVVEEVEETVEQPDEDNNEEPEVQELPVGIVVAPKLNVRKEANKNADVVCIIAKGDEVTVNLEESTEGFYKVYGSNKDVLFEGYCVKEFIKIN